MILYNIISNVHALTKMMNNPRYSKLSRDEVNAWVLVMEVMGICQLDLLKNKEAAGQKENTSTLDNYWNTIKNYLYNNKYEK